MAREPLPLTPVPVPQVRAPQGPVQPKDVAAPFEMLARAYNLEGAASQQQAQAEEKIAGSLMQTGEAVSRAARAGVEEARANIQTSEEVSKLGQTIERDIAIPYAERAGRDAVRAGPDGTLMVDRMPIFGPASKAYESAAAFDYLARLTPQMETELTKMRLQYHGNPAEFQAASRAFINKVVANAPTPELRAALTKAGVDAAERNQRTAEVEADNINKTNTLQSLKAQWEAINERSAGLAHQGGVDQDAYIVEVKNRQAIMDKLVADPRFGYTRERADIELKAARDEDVLEALIGTNVRQFRSRNNLAEAQKALADSLFGPGSENLQVSQTAKYKALGRGQALLERVGVEDKIAKQALDQSVTSFINSVETNPHLWSESRFNDVMQQAIKLGDRPAMLKLDAIKTFQPLFASLKNLSPENQAKAVTEMARGVVPALPVQLPSRDVQSAVEAEAKRQGVNTNLAVMTVMLESGGNPNAVNKYGYRGLFQLSAEEFARHGGTGDPNDAAQNIRAGITSLKRKIGAFTDEFGRPPSATEAYLMHQQGEAGLRAHLAAPERPAWQSMLSTGEGKQKGEAWAKRAIAGNIKAEVLAEFGGVEKITSGQFMAYWQSRVQGLPYEGSTLAQGQSLQTVAAQNPYIFKLWQDAVTKMQTRVSEQAQLMQTEIATEIGKGYLPSTETFKTFAQLVAASGRQDLADKIAPLVEAQRTVERVAQGGPAALAQLQTEINAARAAGADPYTTQALRAASEQATKDLELYKKDPLTAGAKINLIEKVHPIVWGNPAAAAHEFQERETKQQTMRGSGRGVGPSSIMNDVEAETGKEALTHGDAKVAGQILDGIWRTLSKDNRFETLTMKPMREALSGMIRSNNPERQTAAFGILSGLWTQDPAGFKAAFDDSTGNLLSAWLGLRDSFSAEEATLRLNEANLPGKQAAYNELEKKAKDVADDFKPEQVVYEMGSAWPVTPRPIAQALGSQARLPDTSTHWGSVATSTLMADFKRTFVQIARYGVDHDKAMREASKRLNETWGPSEAIGGVMMRLPPEKSSQNRKIEGYPNWMSEQLHEHVTMAKGPQYQPEVSGPGGEFAAWTIKGLISDNVTEADMAAGRSPSYQVVVINHRGEQEIVRDVRLGGFEGTAESLRQQSPDRFVFDRQEAVAKYDRRVRDAAVAATQTAEQQGLVEPGGEEQRAAAAQRARERREAQQRAVSEGVIERPGEYGSAGGRTGGSF